MANFEERLGGAFEKVCFGKAVSSGDLQQHRKLDSEQLLNALTGKRLSHLTRVLISGFESYAWPVLITGLI